MGGTMETYANTAIKAKITEYIHSERDRAILIRRYVDGVTQERLAEEFDLSVPGVKGILRKHRWILSEI